MMRLRLSLWQRVTGRGPRKSMALFLCPRLSDGLWMCQKKAKLPEPNKKPGWVWGGSDVVPSAGGTTLSPTSGDAPSRPSPHHCHHQHGMLSPAPAPPPSRPFPHRGDERPHHGGPGGGSGPRRGAAAGGRGVLQCTRRSLAVRERACDAQPGFMAADGSGAAARLTSGYGLPGSRGPAGAGPVGAEPSPRSGRFCQGTSICPAPTGCWKVPLL